MKPDVPTINLRRVFTAAGLVALLIIYLVLWIRMIGSRAERTGTDFLGFYSAARIAQTDGPEFIYDPARQQAIEQEQVGFGLVPGQVLLFNHLPYLLPVLMLISTTAYVASFIRWTIIILMVLIADAFILVRNLLNLELLRHHRWIVATGLVTFFPAFISIMNGQDTVFVLLGAAMWMLGLLTSRDALAGLGLSIVTIRPQLALILAIPLLFKRRRALVWFLAGSALLGLLCLLLLGPAGIHNLIDFLMVSARGEAYGLHPEDMPTLTGLTRRLFPGLDGDVIGVVGWSGFLLGIVSLAWFSWRSDKIAEAQIGFSVLVSILCVPYLHYHDLTLLVIPLVCLIRLLIPGGRIAPGDLALLPVALSFVMLIGYFDFRLRYPLVYLVMIGLGISLLFPDRIKALTLTSWKKDH